MVMKLVFVTSCALNHNSYGTGQMGIIQFYIYLSVSLKPNISVPQMPQTAQKKVLLSRHCCQVLIKSCLRNAVCKRSMLVSKKCIIMMAHHLFWPLKQNEHGKSTCIWSLYEFPPGFFLLLFLLGVWCCDK